MKIGRQLDCNPEEVPDATMTSETKEDIDSVDCDTNSETSEKKTNVGNNGKKNLAVMNQEGE